MWFARPRDAEADPLSRPTGLEALLRKADIARDEGRVEDAAEHYTAALALAPERNDVKVQLGNMLKDLGRLREADGIYRDAQEHDPEDADIWVQRGHVRKLLGDRTGALEQYRRAATLNPNSFGAAEELADVGLSWQQQQRFEVHFRAGGTELLMAMTRQLDAMRATLDAMAARLPDVLGQTAFPIEVYELFRDLHQVPPPPAGPRVPVTVLLPVDRESPATLYAQLAALQAGSEAPAAVLAFGTDPARGEIVERAAASDRRIRWVALEAHESAVAAERRLAGEVADGWLLLLAPGAVAHRHALAWAAALPGLAPAQAFVCDEDAARPSPDGLAVDAPVFRPVVDYDTLLEANVFGETLLVAASAYRRLATAVPEDSFGQSRGRLLLELARETLVGHVPHVLVSRLDDVRPSLPDHRLAVEAHAAAHGFAERITVARGETGPTRWLPRDGTAGLTVAIPTRDNSHDLAALVRSLRDLAAAPDHLRFVIVDNGGTLPETRATLEVLAAKRYVTLVAEAAPFNWARLSNLAARSADTPLLVFANDDMLMLTDGWDDRLRGLLERDEVGAVGARLLYGDDTVQHAGILLGWKGGTIHDGLYAEAATPGPARRLQATRSTGAVTGAFLAVRRDHFLRLGGFDEVNLPVAYSDIDLCLRLREDGKRIVWTPGITLRHYESKSRGLDHLVPQKSTRGSAELVAMRQRWGASFDRDPAVNPVWVPATTPFRLIAAPSAERVLEHLRLTSRPDPWAVTRVDGGAADLV